MVHMVLTVPMAIMETTERNRPNQSVIERYVTISKTNHFIGIRSYVDYPILCIE